MNARVQTLLIAAALALCLIAGSTPRLVGDGGEYLVQALNFAQLNSPPLDRRSINTLQPQVVRLEPRLEGWDIQRATVAASDRTRDFLHFWFYALLATPLVWVMQLIGVTPLHAFTVLNLGLLGAAFWTAYPRLGRWATVFLFASPVIWWLDKGHTEIFTISLLTIAMVLMRERPWWSLVAAGAAATQNPPITIVFVLILITEVVRRRAALLSDRRLIAGAAIGLALAGLAPTYNYIRHGTPSLLLAATRPGMPTWAEVNAAVLDPSMGLVGNYPLFLISIAGVTVWMLARHRRELLTPELLVAAVSTAVFLYSFARTLNMHHGATPSLTRYALWLLPMSIPVWVSFRAVAGPRGQRLLAATAVASAVISTFAFHPGVSDNAREPTWLASWLWTQHPDWHNPVPEVFAETHLRVEGTRVPVATNGCEKLLLAGSAGGEGVWPVPCLPVPLPPVCRSPTLMCYANRSGDGYTFVRAPGREEDPLRIPEVLWPAGSEETVRRVYAEWGWAAAASKPAEVLALRAHVGLRLAMFGDDSRFMLVLRPYQPGAALRFRSGFTLEGELIDVVTGAVLESPRFNGPSNELWELPIPAGQGGVVILTMRRGHAIE